MLPYDKLQGGFANKQITRNLRFSGFLRSKEGAKIFPAKTKLEHACQLLRQVLQTETMESELPTCEFGYGKYLIVPFFVRFGGRSGSFGLSMGILAGLRLAKIRTMLDQTRLICRRSVPKRYD